MSLSLTAACYLRVTSTSFVCPAETGGKFPLFRETRRLLHLRIFRPPRLCLFPRGFAIGNDDSVAGNVTIARLDFHVAELLRRIAEERFARVDPHRLRKTEIRRMRKD